MHDSHFAQRDCAYESTVKLPRLTSNGTQDDRVVAEECPVALVYDGTTVAILMATPSDLADLALGFSLTEGIIEDVGEIAELSVVPGLDGIEVQTWLRPGAGRLLKDRRRRLIGPTGCGLCGIESLAEANRTRRPVERRISLTPEQIRMSIESLGEAQVLNRATRATHAAGLFRPGDHDMILREDIGRHNALDKLAGALASEGISGRTGAVILTSRISVEMVQKAAAIDAGIVIAVSAPTALAIRTAQAAQVTLIGIARGSDFEIFSHPAGVLR
ncbi:MAG: formate dehydrogenase accessory sulfurtransferase FdhD [Bradyrhizobium sp.]|uniref:formate dehydrogenase accessory sulfurtransferase FdhD n=1 Tax=Bradyrhizobium sp. TaxID=376 RepID=UPI0029A6A971|nr:formate dehydrogenase accessory sulfurtransferase FdhD [Bradyrhizobium sp.]MDX3969160.1 formate dehydrogenase accessory sulfurtransferase FdhD [Bradyrhizobium sp.]